MANPPFNRRPGGVTLVAVLTWISGALDIIGGVLLLFLQNDPQTVVSFGGSAQLITTAIVSIVIGVIVVAVANGLLHGNSGSRLVITVIEVFSIATGIFTAFVAPALFWSELVSILIAVVVILLLWSRPANAFFRS